MNDSHHHTTSAPFCAFEMYFFHPIDEPEVAVDVSGLFASSSTSSATPKDPPSALSSDESDGSTLCRPVPTMSHPDPKEVALSVVSSDEEDDEDDAVSSTDYEFDDRENRPNAGRWGSALSQPTTATAKRPVSEMLDETGDNALRRKQQRRGPGEGSPSREFIDNGDLRPHDDAQQRARVLLWKQSLKRSLFHPFVEQA